MGVPVLELLGPPRARVDGVDVPLPGRRAALLALLLARAPRAASLAEVLDAIYDDAAPASARNAVHVLVSTLRRQLGRDAVETAGDGYRLAPAIAEAADVTAAVLAAAEGRRLLLADQPDAARAVLAPALDRWRGPALAGVRETGLVRAEVDRLTALHRTIRTDLARAALALGQVQDAVEALADLTADDPLNEELRALQVLALSRAGRQVDALAVVEEVRERLRDELGLDPSPVLVEAQRQVLAQDAPARPAAPTPAAADAPAATAPPAAASGRPRGHHRAPRPLPPPPMDETIGRDADLDAVHDLLGRSPGRMVTVLGPGGVGKSRTALLVAHAARAQGVTAALAPLGAVRTPVELLAATAESLGVRSPGDQTAAIAAALAGRPALLVWDEAEGVEGAAAVADELRAALPDLRLLVTSRVALGARGEVRHVLAPLHRREDGTGPAEHLFLARVRAHTPDLVVDDDLRRAAHEVVARCDGLPLAIELAAARTRALSVGELARSLADGEHRPTAAGRRDPLVHDVVAASVDRSVELLPPPALAALRRLTATRGGFDLDTAAALTGLEPDEAAEVLADLVDHSLVRRIQWRDGRSRYALLELVRRHVAAGMAVEELADAAHVHAAHHAARLSPAHRPVRLRWQAAEWAAVLDERASIRSAVRWAVEAGPTPLLADLVIGAAMVWFDVGPHVEIAAWMDALDRRPDLDARRRADVATWRAKLDDAANRLEEALHGFTAAAERAVAAGDPARAALALAQAGFPALKLRRVDEAAALIGRARAALDGHEDPEVDAIVMSTEALAANVAGDVDRARALQERALETIRAEGLELFLPLALANLADIVGRTDPVRALAIAEEGMEVGEVLLDDWHRMHLLGQRGQALLQLGRLAEAEADLVRSAWMAVTVGLHSWVHSTLRCLAAVLAAHDPHTALRLLGVEGAADGRPMSEPEREVLAPHLDPLEGAVGAATAARLREEGAVLVRRLGLAGAMGQVLPPTSHDDGLPLERRRVPRPPAGAGGVRQSGR